MQEATLIKVSVSHKNVNFCFRAQGPQCCLRCSWLKRQAANATKLNQKSLFFHYPPFQTLFTCPFFYAGPFLLLDFYHLRFSSVFLSSPTFCAQTLHVIYSFEKIPCLFILPQSSNLSNSSKLGRLKKKLDNFTLLLFFILLLFLFFITKNSNKETSHALTSKH